MDVGDIEVLDVGRASPDQLRAAAQRYRAMAGQVAAKYAWSDRYRPAPAPRPGPTLSDLVSTAEPPTAEELEERQRVVRQRSARAGVTFNGRAGLRLPGW
jgi:hypothetical protein